MNKLNEPLAIMRRELKIYFTTPIAYIVIILFLTIAGIWFFKDFFYENQADLRDFFEFLPALFIFIIPAITMRLFSEEKNSGSIEILMTLPVTSNHVVLGKFFAAVMFIVIMLVPTLFYAITVELTGSPFYGQLIGGYIGAVLLGCAYAAIGILMSSITRYQIIAYFATLAVCGFLWLVDKFMIFIPQTFRFVQNFSSDYHFQNIAKGVIDSRDVLYFATIVIISLLITVRVIEERS